MRKVLASILALVVSISLCACSKEIQKTDNSVSMVTQDKHNLEETKTTKEEMLGSASELDIAALSRATKENQVKARQDYAGNCYTYSGYVLSINDGSAQIGLADTEYHFNVLLENDDLAQLAVNEYVTVVGNVLDVSVETQKIEYVGGSYEKTFFVGTMEPAWLISDTFELTGTLEMFEHSFYYSGNLKVYTDNANAWYLIVNDKGNTKEYYLKDIQSVVPFESALIDENEIEQGTEITISGQIQKSIGEIANPSLEVVNVRLITK